VRRRLLDALLYVPARGAYPPPPGLAAEDLAIETADGERLHAWWIRARGASLGHLLYCHGNGGTLVDRAPHARLLSAAGFDVLLFDYRGYGASTGRPAEAGTHLDARAARETLLAREEVDPRRVIYLGESLGGAVALALALEAPPAGLILQSAFTSVRDVARVHYPFIPRAVVPDAYPSLRLIPELRAPLLVLHGRRDEIVPVAHGERLHAAAPEPKTLRVFADVGHNDLLTHAADEWLAAITAWARDLQPR
jgi:hypothetical protein